MITPFDLIGLGILGLLVIMWLMYVAEAFRQDLLQGVLTLAAPFYVLYFAFIRSRRSASMGLLMSALLVASVVVSGF